MSRIKGLMILVVVVLLAMPQLSVAQDRLDEPVVTRDTGTFPGYVTSMIKFPRSFLAGIPTKGLLRIRAKFWYNRNTAWLNAIGGGFSETEPLLKALRTRTAQWEWRRISDIPEECWLTVTLEGPSSFCGWSIEAIYWGETVELFSEFWA